MTEAVTAPVRGTVDAFGQLTFADAPLLRLQKEAGAALGEVLAIPQLASLARLARSLGVVLSRPALAGSADGELDLWVRAAPVGDEVQLVIERWVERPAPSSRWGSIAAGYLAETDSSDLFETDTELCLTDVGSRLARRLVTGPGGATGQPLTRFVTLVADEDGTLPLLASVAARRAFVGQRGVIRRDGSEIVISGDPVTGPTGDFIGYRGRALPFAHPELTQDEGNEPFDELLRRPLDVIVIEAEQIAGRSEGPLRNDYAAYGSDIAGAARHLLDVLRNMGRDLAPVLPDSGRIDLAALAAEAAGLVQAEAAEAGVSLELEGATSLFVSGQASAVTQILVNLIGNAVRYSPRGSIVRIAAGESIDSASVTVADNGPGVSKPNRDRIFERFEQAAPVGKGAGLGLAIARRLARQMGGDILLDSKPGKGAKFTLQLPLG